MRTLIDGYQPDYVILAKYMRVLTPSFVEAYPRKIINIHHSFLPAFIGARPYRQAFDRGVKLIGATAHFVTDDLDEGPIVEQDVIHVDHTFSADDAGQAGRDVEKSVLSRALELGAEQAGLRLRQQDSRVQISGCAPPEKKAPEGAFFHCAALTRVQRQTIDGHGPLSSLSSA